MRGRKTARRHRAESRPSLQTERSLAAGRGQAFELGAENDGLERQADQVADQVLAGSAAEADIAATPRRTIQRTRSTLQPQITAESARLTSDVGRQLEPKTRRFVEPRFGIDFANVRVHAGAAAYELTSRFGASALTVGSDIYFAKDRYSPDSNAGRRLLSHELTHVVQQSGGAAAHRSQSSGARQAISRAAVGATPLIQRRTTEVHINLRGRDRVIVHRKGARPIVYRVTAGGWRTGKLIRLKSYRALFRHPTRKVGKWGLQYFIRLKGQIGIHSTLIYPRHQKLCALGVRRYCNKRKYKPQKHSRVKHWLRNTARAQSHGCIRMDPQDVRELWHILRTAPQAKIFIYSRRADKAPSWARGHSRARLGSKSLQTHTVRRNRGLNWIARRYGVSRRALVRINRGRLRWSRGRWIVWPGDVILIPRRSRPKSTSRRRSGTRSGRRHRVLRGQSISLIAQKHRVTLRALIRANRRRLRRNRRTGRLDVWTGDVLVIP